MRWVFRPGSAAWSEPRGGGHYSRRRHGDEYETPGLKDEGMYWKVFVLRDSSFLSGFIPTEDFEDAR